MGFTQTMTVRTADGQALADLMSSWHASEAGIAPGYLGSRLLADRDDPGRFMVVVDFSSYEEAEANNARAETQEWASRLQAASQGDPEFGNWDAIPTTG